MGACSVFPTKQDQAAWSCSTFSDKRRTSAEAALPTHTHTHSDGLVCFWPKKQLSSVYQWQQIPRPLFENPRVHVSTVVFYEFYVNFSVIIGLNVVFLVLVGRNISIKLKKQTNTKKETVSITTKKIILQCFQPWVYEFSFCCRKQAKHLQLNHYIIN